VIGDWKTEYNHDRRPPIAEPRQPAGAVLIDPLTRAGKVTIA
jgi:hypothetical protein